MPRTPVLLPNTIGSSQAVVITWANVPVRDSDIRQHLMQHLDVQVTSIWNAGGATTPEEDQRVLHAAAEVPDRFSTPRVLLMLVKAWEPPMLEVIDFLCALRRALGKASA